MVNSGSILTNALLQTLMKPEMSLAEKFDYVNDYVKVRLFYVYFFYPISSLTNTPLWWRPHL